MKQAKLPPSRSEWMPSLSTQLLVAQAFASLFPANRKLLRPPRVFQSPRWLKGIFHASVSQAEAPTKKVAALRAMAIYFRSVFGWKLLTGRKLCFLAARPRAIALLQGQLHRQFAVPKAASPAAWETVPQTDGRGPTIRCGSTTHPNRRP